ncbi:hypothetical protein EMN47_13960 [Prolixibacteraceae bacterium JC049]|nr:hypothetical protein [Prolixibacteraceae bacterium JC049]
MRSILKLGLVMAVVLIATSAFAQKNNDWQKELKKQLEVFGHRNWIMVVDAAYPAQSKAAIKTIATGEKQLDVVKIVLDAVEKAPHVYPEVFLDKEIDFVKENQKPGIEKYRKDLFKMLKGKSVSKELHEELIAKIDEAAKTFNILVLKTDLVLPYTSVFIRLDCGYWNGKQEAKMREAMK